MALRSDAAPTAGRRGSSCGVATDLMGDVKVMYLGHDVLLSVHRATGAYALLRVQRAPARLVPPPAGAPTDDGEAITVQKSGAATDGQAV